MCIHISRHITGDVATHIPTHAPLQIPMERVRMDIRIWIRGHADIKLAGLLGIQGLGICSLRLGDHGEGDRKGREQVVAADARGNSPGTGDRQTGSRPAYDRRTRHRSFDAVVDAAPGNGDALEHVEGPGSHLGASFEDACELVVERA